MNRFAQPPQSWQEITGFIQETALGREILKRFLSLCQSGKLRVQAYPQDLRVELLAVQAPGCPLGAAFITDGWEGRILYDGQGELGIVVPFVFHEMVHSLDERLWAAAQQNLGARDRNELIYSSECLAFSAQHELQVGLKKIYPELNSFHKDRYPHLGFLNREFSPQDIALLYGFEWPWEGLAV